jgi:hypothetical protein
MRKTLNASMRAAKSFLAASPAVVALISLPAGLCHADMPWDPSMSLVEQVHIGCANLIGEPPVCPLVRKATEDLAAGRLVSDVANDPLWGVTIDPEKSKLDCDASPEPKTAGFCDWDRFRLDFRDMPLPIFESDLRVLEQNFTTVIQVRIDVNEYSRDYVIIQGVVLEPKNPLGGGRIRPLERIVMPKAEFRDEFTVYERLQIVLSRYFGPSTINMIKYRLNSIKR